MRPDAASPTAVRVAAVDCGTNSIRLLVTDLDADAATQTDQDRRLRIVRLGEGVDATGRLAPAALGRVLDACAEYADVVAALGAERIRFCATSAARDAADVTDLAAGVRRVLGADLEVVSAGAEATLTAAGAIRGIADLTHARQPDVRLPAPHLVVDIGGGSTELVASTAHGEALEGQSVRLGSVRLTERLMPGRLSHADEVRAVRVEVDRAITELPARPPVRSLVGVGGTVTTVAAHALRLEAYDSARIHRAQIPLTDVLASCEALAAASVDERQAMPFMHPGRVDVIAAGALILEGVIHTLTEDAYGWLVVSEHDILDGIAWSMVDSDR